MRIPEPVIFQLKVVLQGISPMIWRRLLIHGDSTIADLHYIVQIAMGWSDDHLHQFRIHGKRYGIARMGGISFSDDPESVRLKDLGLRINERFVYEYEVRNRFLQDVVPRMEARSIMDMDHQSERHARRIVS